MFHPRKLVIGSLAVITLFIVAPLISILIQALNVEGSVWTRLFSNRIPFLTVNSLLLILSVSLISLVVGTTLALLVEKTNLPGRKIFAPLLITPLIIPCFITGICYINIMGINGLAESCLLMFGLETRIPNIYGFWGATFILTTGTYPYVYTIVRSALKNMDRQFFDVAQTLGCSKFKILLKIYLPLLLPAFSAGIVLVALYVLADFGVVSLLRYKTFVNTIYEQMTGRYNFSNATILSTILIAFTFLFFIIQEKVIKQKRFSLPKIKKTRLAETVFDLKWLKIPAVVFCSLIFALGFLIPLLTLVYWFTQSYFVPVEANVWRIPFSDVLFSGLQSFLLAASVATISVLLAIPIGYLYSRHLSKSSRMIYWFSQSGIAIPGVLTALGVLLFLKPFPTGIRYSIFAIIFALLVHFLAKGLQFITAGFQQIPNRLEEGARALGKNSWLIFWKITRPLLTPSILMGWTLVFLSAMRELPASLLLRPAGFDPLTVKVWTSASEGFYELSAAPALVLILISFPIILFIGKDRGYQE